MDDRKIVDLYWQRSEDAIPETSAKYGSYCRIIAYNVLANNEDSEECVNDTWLGAWNSMPKNKPEFLAPYLGKLTRWISLTRLRNTNTMKHGSGELAIALDELSDCLDSGCDTQRQVEMKELSLAIRSFLAGMEETRRNVFIARYWFLASIDEIAKSFGFGKSKVKSMLMRTRRDLKAFLEEEELC